MSSTDKPSVYLDYAAATPCDERVVAAMLPYLTERFYNPSSPYLPAVEVRRDFEAARGQIARILGVKPADSIMTAGATESINLALTAAADGHVVTSAMEHHAVLATAQQYDHTIVAVDSSGIVEPETITRAITDTTQLVTIGLANNELGTIQRLRDIAAIVRDERDRRRAQGVDRPIWLHSDASQGVGQIDISVARLGVDMLTINAAKCYGPKQVALLWRAPGVVLQPIIRGGGQESGLRSGTENVAGVVGFARALELAEAGRRQEAKRLGDLRDQLQQQLVDHFGERMIVNGHVKKRLPGHLHIAFPGIDAERLVFLLEAEGVYVATGSACAANHGTRSHVLTAVGLSDSEADGSLRLSLGRGTTEQAIEHALQAIISAVESEIRRVRK